jgi:hypothetical protein
MRISSTGGIEGRRVLYTIGKIKAASPWHAASGGPSQDNWREAVLSELIREAEDIDADASSVSIMKPTVPFRSARPGFDSSAFSPSAWRSSYPARRSARFVQKWFTRFRVIITERIRSTARTRGLDNAPHVNPTSNSITDSPASVSADRLDNACFDCDRLCG